MELRDFFFCLGWDKLQHTWKESSTERKIDVHQVRRLANLILVSWEQVGASVWVRGWDLEKSMKLFILLTFFIFLKNCFKVVLCSLTFDVNFFSFWSGTCYDHGPAVWWSVLCGNWYRSWAEIPERCWPSRFLQSAELHRCHQRALRPAPARRHW